MRGDHHGKDNYDTAIRLRRGGRSRINDLSAGASISAAKLAATTAVVGTIGTVASGLMFPEANGDVRFPESSCGSGRGSILVAYASEFGTTGEIAEPIASALCGAGATVDTRQIRNVEDLSGYSAVVIGGAIQYDNWMSEARDFVTRNEDALSRMPVAYFFTCMVLSKPSDKADSKADGYAKKLEAVSQRVTPVAVGRFAGVLDYGRMNLRTRIASKILYTMLRVGPGDYRDWKAIKSWVNELHPEMTR